MNASERFGHEQGYRWYCGQGAMPDGLVFVILFVPEE